LAKFEEMNHRWGIAVSYGRLGQAEVALGRLGDAAGHFLTCFDRATEAGLVEQQHYAITGIGLALAKASRFEAAAALLAPEAVEERNPYRDFAADALARLPEELREPADDEMPALDDLADIARTHAAELAREP
jgi:hypothetical protein